MFITGIYNGCFLQPTTKLFIDGKFVESQTNDWIDIHDPVSLHQIGSSALSKMKCCNALPGLESGERNLFVISSCT